MESDKPTNGPPETKNVTKKSSVAQWILIALCAVLIASGGYLAWLDKDLSAKNAALTKDKTTAAHEVVALKAALAQAQKKVASAPTTTTCSDTPTASLQANIHDAISSKNTAALEGYMASSVTVVIAASEKGGSESAAAAVADLDYLSSATSPWNFSLSAATLANWRAHFYASYFSITAYAGEAASHQVVSFDFDCSGKIDQIFMAASSDLLTE